mgnify:CR=1 FL=1
MIEIFGLLYGVGKDIMGYLQWSEDAKLVDGTWLEKSGFQDAMENEGYTLRWVRTDKCEAAKLDGYEIVYEIDKDERKRRRIERHGVTDKLVLMGNREQ